MSVTTSEVIDVTVLNDMSLHLHPADIGREGEHNSAVFHIVQQPASLDPLACRAEVTIAGKSTYRLVEDGYFNLTNDITEVKGTGQLQLVYSDGTDVIRKTTIAVFQVTSSLNAVDESDPDFQDGLAQLQSAAFTSVVNPGPGPSPVATFLNLAGQPVGVLVFPPAGGGDLTEVRADTLYVRQNGTSVMSGDLRLISSQGIDGPISVIVGGRQAALRWDGALILTRGQANEPVQIENNNGTNRSDIITQASGDARYVQPPVLDAYALRSGAQFTGPLISAPGTGLTNPGLAIGDNATGFYRTGGTLLLSVGGALYTQYLASPPSMMLTVPLNMATQQITNVGTPPADTTGNGMAMPRAYADARYLQLATGGIVQGPVQITQSPVVPNDVTNKAYVDGRVRQPAPVVIREVGANLNISSSGAWVALTTPITFTNPAADSTVMCVSVMVNATTANVASANLRINSQGTTLAERQAFIYGAQGGSGFTAQFYRSVFGASVGPFTVEIQSIGAPAADFTVIGGIADGPRSQIAVYEVGPPA